MKKKVAAIIVLLAVVCTSMAFAAPKTCKTCDGDGKVWGYCPDCKGKGRQTGKCTSCNGKGSVTIERKLSASEMAGKGTLKSTEKVTVNCSSCGGSKKMDRICVTCNGREGAGAIKCSKCNGKGTIGLLNHDHDHEHEYELSPMLWISYAGIDRAQQSY